MLGVRRCAQVQGGGRSWKKNIWMEKGEQNSNERTWPNDPFVTVPAAIWPLVKVDRGMSVALYSSMSTASCLLGTAIWKDLAFVIRPGLHLPTMHSWKSDKDSVSNTGLGWWEEPAMISYHQHWHQRLSSPQESSFSIRLLLSSVPLSGNTGFFISAFLFICVSLGGGAELCHLRAPNHPDLTEITLQHGHTPLERPGVNMKALEQFQSLSSVPSWDSITINRFIMRFLLNGMKTFLPVQSLGLISVAGLTLWTQLRSLLLINLPTHARDTSGTCRQHLEDVCVGV